MAKPTFVMRSRMATRPEEGVKLVAKTMTEPYFRDVSDPTLYRPLRLIAQHLLDNPDLIQHPDVTPHVCAILQQFLIDHPPAKSRPAVIAALVDRLLIEVPGRKPMSLVTARRAVAKAMDKKYLAVKKSHERYGARSGTK